MVFDLDSVRDIPVEARTLRSVLELQATSQPAKPALICGDHHLTYEELYAEARRLAAGFTSLGLDQGTAVLLMLDNHLDFALTWFGVNLAGGIQVPVNTAYLGGMLAHLLEDSGAAILVIEQHYLERLAQVWAGRHELRHVVVRADTGEALDGPWRSAIALAELKNRGVREPVKSDAWEPMGYLYTSGTTGPSKGVVTSHAHAFTYSMTHWVTGSDRVMVNLPMFHIGGQWAGVYAAIIAGATAVIMPRFHASTFWRDAAQFGCTQTMLIGAMATFLLNQEPAASDRGHPMQRVVMGPIIAGVREFERRFGVVTGSGYGLTEGGTPMVTPYGRTEPGLVGWLRPAFDARIADDNDLEVPPGVVGELLLRSSEPWTTMTEYLGRPRETAAALRNQWLHTGDYMYRDEAGQFFFVDRKKDAMRVRGENVSSQEVESVINRHAAVLESACVAAPSESTEDDIRAFVVLRDGMELTAEDLLDFLVTRLPYFMIPRFVDFAAALPRTPTARVKKDELRRRPFAGSWDREHAGYRVKRDGRA